MTQISIQSINLTDEYITVLFDKSWFQEDIGSISLLLLQRIADHQIKETTLGADRETIRFVWQNAEFILNFDYYSQSCWFSTLDDLSAAQVETLFSTLTKD